MGQVADILRHKGGAVRSVTPETSVYDAIVLMVDANVGSLLVLEEGEPVGIVTERDYLRRVALTERTARAMRIREVMSAPVVSVTSDTTVDECMEIMTERRFRHLPVLDDGELAGIVSIGDVVKFKTVEQSSHIGMLTEYITAR